MRAGAGFGVKRSIDLGEFIEPSPMLLKDYLDKWLKMIKSKVRERTYTRVQRVP